MVTREQALRSAIAFFLITFSTALLMTIGVRLTGWFTRMPDAMPPEALKGLGIVMMIGVLTLAIGAGIRRMDANELRSALLGGASILLAIPTSYAAINHNWTVSTTLISSFGLLLLAAGLLVALGLRGREGD